MFDREMPSIKKEMEKLDKAGEPERAKSDGPFDLLRAKEDTFSGIWRDIEPLIAKGEYGEARRIVKSELSLLAGAAHGDEREELAKLQKEFEAYIPEAANWLLSTETPEAKGRERQAEAARIDAAEARSAEEAYGGLMEENGGENDQKDDKEGGGGLSDALPLVEKRTWSVPSFEEMRRGLFLEVSYPASAKETFEIFEIIGEPHLDEATGTYFVSLRNVERNWFEERSLSDMGILPYQNGKWNPVNRPLRWYRREERKTESS